jgi:hypothetical protein
MNRGVELTNYLSRRDGAPDRKRRDAVPKPQGEDETPLRERRASYRVRDDQQSGQGSLSALSKLKMLERKRAAVQPARDEPPREEPL